MYAKNFEFHGGLLCYAFCEAETKEAFCFLLFLQTMTSKSIHMVTKSRAMFCVYILSFKILKQRLPGVNRGRITVKATEPLTLLTFM